MGRPPPKRGEGALLGDLALAIKAMNKLLIAQYIF